MASLFSALNHLRAGLKAYELGVTTSSGNLVNAEVQGFKSKNVNFNSVVSGQLNYNNFQSNGVNANIVTDMSSGTSQTTGVPTNMRIKQPDSFFIVATDKERTNIVFTRIGDFKADSEGFLRNSLGHYLLSWPYNDTADKANQYLVEDRIAYGSDGLPVNKSDFNTLVMINKNDFQGSAQKTRTINFSYTLDANEKSSSQNIKYLEQTNGLGGLIQDGPDIITSTMLTYLQTMNDNDTAKANHERLFTIYDAQGKEHTISVNIMKAGINPKKEQKEFHGNQPYKLEGNNLKIESFSNDFHGDIPTHDSSIIYIKNGTEHTLDYSHYDATTGTFTLTDASLAGVSAVIRNALKNDSEGSFKVPHYHPVANKWIYEISSDSAYDSSSQQTSTTGSTLDLDFKPGSLEATLREEKIKLKKANDDLETAKSALATAKEQPGANNTVTEQTAVDTKQQAFDAAKTDYEAALTTANQVGDDALIEIDISATDLGNHAELLKTLENMTNNDNSSRNGGAFSCTDDNGKKISIIYDKITKILDVNGDLEKVSFSVKKKQFPNEWRDFGSGTDMNTIKSFSISTNSYHHKGILSFGSLVFNNDGSLNENDSTNYTPEFLGSHSTPAVIYKKNRMSNAKDFDIIWDPLKTGAAGKDHDNLSAHKIYEMGFGNRPGYEDTIQQASNSDTGNFSSKAWQDGSGFGVFDDFFVDTNSGFLYAEYAKSGKREKTHQIALATFTDPEKLEEQSGEGPTYNQSASSGDYRLQSITSDSVDGNQIEKSNSDTGHSLTLLIQQQKHYSACGSAYSKIADMLSEFIQMNR